MGKASSNKKVARAARTGGGRTRRGTASLGWPAVMAVVVILGTILVVTSRSNLGKAEAVPPRPNADHWHAAIGFKICDEFAANPHSDSDPLGIHTHDDGVIHIHPFVARAAGRKAILSHFFDNVGAKVTATQIDLPGYPVKKNGQKCDGKAAKVQTKVWDTRDPSDQGRVLRGDPGSLLLKNNMLITVAFVPEGADIPRPPSEPELDRLTDVGPAVPPPAPTGEEPVPPEDTVPGAPSPSAPGAPAAPAAPAPATPGTTAPAPPAAGATPTTTPRERSCCWAGAGPACGR